MEPAEELFLRLISSFRIEDIRAAITGDMDLAKITREELPEYIEGFKLAADQYRRTHPGKEQAIEQDPEGSARRVVSWLKIWRPDLGYEIEAYRKYTTIENAGFVAKSRQGDVGIMEVTSAPLPDIHVGYRWVATNLKSFLRLFS